MEGTHLRKVFFFAGAAALFLVVVSCQMGNPTVAPPPEIPGAKFVGMKVCSGCHKQIAKDFSYAFHSRIVIPGQGERVQGQGCEACHGPGSLHVRNRGQGFIVNPKDNPAACFKCHLDKEAEFNLPYHHPLREGRMSCTSCHDPHAAKIKKPAGIFITRTLNDTCYQCHREQARPHVFEHEALREGCTTCHAVHGSINDKMLVERNANLCLKCHAQIAAPNAAPRSIFINDFVHTPRLAEGVCWSADCHTAVHGSNINNHLRF
jgi:predicted CXXCH cytochrome family protein